jgi:hypothetical protein
MNDEGIIQLREFLLHNEHFSSDEMEQLIKHCFYIRLLEAEQ